MSTDLDLLDEWRSGDRAAGNELVRRHFALVYRFFRTKLDGPVDDLVQTTFVACTESRDRFRGEGSFRSFVLGIARFKLLHHLRKKHRQGTAFPPAEVSVRELAGQDEPTPSMLVLQHDEQKLLLRALRHIPVDFQIAVELRYWEEMSTPEIAAVLEIPPGTVRSRLTRARAMLKDLIAKLAATPELREETLSRLDHRTRSAGTESGAESGDD
jgi:RNA polymerase sigma-70 factor (ECF subfamily)